MCCCYMMERHRLLLVSMLEVSPQTEGRRQYYAQGSSLYWKIPLFPNSSQKDSPNCNQETQPEPAHVDDLDCSMETIEEKDQSTIEEKAPDTQEELSTMTFKKLWNRQIPLVPK